MIYEKDITRSLKAILCEAVSINKHMGSSTAVLLGLDPQTAIMRTTNLGDSGYMIFRAKEDGEKIVNKNESCVETINSKGKTK